jgi:hypothetical protein
MKMTLATLVLMTVPALSQGGAFYGFYTPEHLAHKSAVSPVG